MRRSSKAAAKKRPITVAAARRSARIVKAKRGNRPYPVTPELWERYLGHFGPPVKRTPSKKRASAKKPSKKRAA